MSVEGHQAQGRRGHAGVHERAVARLLRRRWGSRSSKGATSTAHDVKENAKTAIVNRQFADHFFPGQSAVGRHIGNGTGPKAKLDIEIVGVVANALYEGPREGIRRQVFIPNWGKGGVTLLRAHDRRFVGGVRRDPQPGAEARRVDAGLRDEDARGTARRDADDRSADRAARRRLRPARDAARVDRSLRRDGVRRRAAPQGARHPPRARRRAGRRDLAGDEGSAAAARRSASPSASRRRWRSAASSRRSCTASRRAIR